MPNRVRTGYAKLKVLVEGILGGIGELPTSI